MTVLELVEIISNSKVLDNKEIVEVNVVYVKDDGHEEQFDIYD